MTTTAIDMSGQAIGHIHVMHRSYAGKARGAKWWVICGLCKAEFWALGNKLRAHIKGGTALKCMECGE